MERIHDVKKKKGGGGGGISPDGLWAESSMAGPGWDDNSGKCKSLSECAFIVTLHTFVLEVWTNSFQSKIQ